MTKNRSTLLGRRKAAIIISAILVIALVIALIFVLDYVNATEVDVDGTTYFVREKKNVYALYDTDKKTVLPTEEQYGYFVTHAGTLVEVDAETGEYEIIATVDTEGNEVVGFNNRVLIFPHLEKKNIMKLEVHNSEGEFTFVRLNLETDKEDSKASFVIKDSPLTVYDQELFASLHVSAGYTLTTLKVQDPIKDADGLYSEYGLIPETRVREKTDGDGEFVLDEETGDYIYEQYEYTPAYYIITDISGNSYKLIIGDRLVTGGGYYVQYEDTITGEKRDAVYVLSADIADSLLAPIEDFVTPQLTYPMTMNTYLWVEKFLIAEKNPDYDKNDKDSEEFILPVYFSFVPLEDRQGTIDIHTPFFFEKGFELDGYGVSTDNINTALSALYQPAFNEVIRLNPTDEELVEYGLAVKTGVDKNGHPTYEFDSKYFISFNYDIYDESTSKVEGTVNNQIYISEIDGKYYAFTIISPVENGDVKDKNSYTLNMIVEIAPHTFEFLKWDQYDWIYDKYVALNIAHVDKIELFDHVNGYNASFDLDNSKTEESENVSSSLLSVTANDSNGNSTETFSQLSVFDQSGNTWVITSSEIKCYSPAGAELKITSAYYDYNALGKQVRVNKGQIKCSDGRLVTVNADTIVINGAENKTISRYDTDLFRRLYQTLLNSTISNSYKMSEEDEKALISDESKLLLTMKITDYLGGVKEYKFYKLTSRKAYITINGNGGFYVLSGRVEKFVSDSQRFFALQDIEATDKY